MTGVPAPVLTGRLALNASAGGIMGTLLQLLNKSGLAADVEAALPEVVHVAELAQHWRDIAARLWQSSNEVPVDSPDRFIAYLAGAIGKPEVKQVFDDLGLASLHGELSGISAKLADPATPWGALVSRMSDFGEAYAGGDTFGGYDEGDGRAFALTLPDIDAGGAGAAGPAQFDYSFALEGGVEAEPGALWPFPKDAAAPGLLRLGVNGGLKAKAGAKLPFSGLGSAGLNIDGSLASSFNLYYRPGSPDAPVAGVLLKAVPGVPDPFDLVSIRHAMQLSGLEGLVMGFSGSAKAGLSLLLGQNFDIPQVLAGEVGLAAALSYGRQSDWLISLRRLPGGALRYVLSRKKLSQSEWSVGLKLSLDPSALVSRVQDVLSKATGVWGKELDKIRPYLSPGTLLRGELQALVETEIGKLIEDDKIKAALLADAGILADPGSDDGESDLVTLLTGKIADVLDKQETAILGDARGLATKAVGDLADSLPSFAGDALRGKGEALLTDLLGKAQGKFKGEFDKLVANANVAKTVNKELKNLGVRIEQAADEIDKATRGLRELVEKFDAAVKQVGKEVEKAAKAKLVASIAARGGSDSSAHYELSGTISGDSAGARQLWRDLATGKLEPFQKIFAGAMAGPADFTLDPSSTIKLAAGRHSGFAASLVVLDLQVNMKDLISGKAEITYTAGGNVSVRAEGSAEHGVRLFKERRRASFVSVWDLVRDRLDTTLDQSMSLSLKLDHEDKDLKAEEVKGLFEGCARIGLIERKRCDDALDIRQSWQNDAAAGGKKVKGAIALEMTLTPLATGRMIALGRRLRDGDGQLDRLVHARAMAALVLAGAASQDMLDLDVKKALHDYRDDLNGITDAGAIAYAFRKNRFDFRELGGDGAHASYYGWKYPAFARMLPAAYAFTQLLPQMAKVADAVPARLGVPAPGAWTEKDYRDAEFALARSSSEFLDVNAEWLKIKLALHPRMLGLMVLLAQVSAPGPADEPEALLARPIDPVWAGSLFKIAMTPGDPGTGGKEPEAIPV